MADVAELRAKITAWGERVHRAATADMAAKLTPPRKTGRFEGTRQVDPTSGSGPTFVSTIGYPGELGEWLDEGTSPHLIEGNPFLSFYWPRAGGRVVFRSVQHPGTPGTNFWSRVMHTDSWYQSLNRAAASVAF